MRIGDARGDWPDELRSILWAYRTSHKTAMGETLFKLAFDLEATIPVEVNLPILKRLEPSLEGQITEHLNLLEEVREQASLKAASYQDRIAKYFNSKGKPWRFKNRDLVLRRVEATGRYLGKLRPAWEGLFKVIWRIKDGAYSLRDTSGRPLSRPWNVDNLKIYYK